jgi:predicted DNA-binding antitoxin AbrB/MazE fold protein
MPQVIEAVYRDGVFRPDKAVSGLSEGQRVRVTIDASVDVCHSEGKEEELLRSLEARGLLEKPDVPPAPADFQPLQIPGPGLSETIIAERR